MFFFLYRDKRFFCAREGSGSFVLFRRLALAIDPLWVQLLLFRLHMNREIGFSRSLWGFRTFPSGNFRLSFSGSLRDLDLENLKAGDTGIRHF